MQRIRGIAHYALYKFTYLLTYEKRLGSMCVFYTCWVHVGAVSQCYG